MIEVFPFMQRVSKHSEPFFSNLLVAVLAIYLFAQGASISCLLSYAGLFVHRFMSD
jgi:hypothetical protein